MAELPQGEDVRNSVFRGLWAIVDISGGSPSSCRPLDAPTADNCAVGLTRLPAGLINRYRQPWQPPTPAACRLPGCTSTSNGNATERDEQRDTVARKGNDAEKKSPESRSRDALNGLERQDLYRDRREFGHRPLNGEAACGAGRARRNGLPKARLR